jgi:transcriptional regulator with XRE-family HTH domain
MTTAAVLLRQVRAGTRRTEVDLERFSGVRQTAISRAERGRQDLTMATLERLVPAAGWRVTVLPTQAGNVADAADACRQHLAVGSEEGAYRAVIQLADWLASEHGAERVALTVTPPAPTGDRRYDAFIAGVVEHRLSEESLPYPKWLPTSAKLAEQWFVDTYSADDPAVMLTVRHDRQLTTDVDSCVNSHGGEQLRSRVFEAVVLVGRANPGFPDDWLNDKALMFIPDNVGNETPRRPREARYPRPTRTTI